MWNDTRLPKRFWAKVERVGQCWVWTGARNRMGYGDFYIGGAKGHDAPHRVAYYALVGRVPAGQELDHLCRRPSCVNPAHLEPVTHAENVRRGRAGVLKAQAITHCPAGHAYEGANLYVAPKGDRYCRTCMRSRKQSALYREQNRLRERARRAGLR